MANLQNIKILSRERKIPIRAISEQLGVTEQGLHKMIREETMSAVVLEKVAKILNVNVCVFFDRDTLCGHVEEYNATGERGIAAKTISRIDNRNMATLNKDQQELQEQLLRLQRELLEAKSEIIDLLKDRK